MTISAADIRKDGDAIDVRVGRAASTPQGDHEFRGCSWNAKTDGVHPGDAMFSHGSSVDVASGTTTLGVERVPGEPRTSDLKGGIVPQVSSCAKSGGCSCAACIGLVRVCCDSGAIMGGCFGLSTCGIAGPG